MKITTVNGVEIDTESQAYKDFLRDVQHEATHGAFPEPSGYPTVGDMIELERRRNAVANQISPDREPENRLVKSNPCAIMSKTPASCCLNKRYTDGGESGNTDERFDLRGGCKVGQIRLRNGETLPEDATVYVVVPGRAAEERAVYPVTIPAHPRIASPRLVQKEDAPRFRVEMTEDADARV